MCQALHDLDRLVYCFGPATVISSTLKTNRHYINVEDEAHIELEFPNNIKCSFDADTISAQAWTGKTTIEGAKGNIILNSEFTPEWFVTDFPKPKANEENYEPDIKPRYYGPCHGLIIDNFIDAIITKRQPLVSGESTLATLKVLFEIYQKANKNQN